MAKSTKNTFERREKKLLIDNCKVDSFVRDILPYMVPDEYNIDGKPYMISNLYFDDELDSIIRTSVSKPPFKEKLRVRSYGIPDENTKVFIEIKRKLKGIGTKRRARLTLSQLREYLDTGKHPEGLKYIDEQVLCEIDYYLQINKVKPKVYISYMRNAYFGKDDPDFRVTLDKEITTRRYDLDLSLGSYGDLLLPEGKTLLEIKFAGAVPLWFARVMSKYSLSFGSYSKYGMEFKKTQRRINFEEA